MKKKLFRHALRWVVLLLAFADAPRMSWAETPHTNPAIQVLPLGDGETFFSSSAAFFSSTREYSGDGTSQDIYSGRNISSGQFSEFCVNFHYENGVASWITLVADIGYRTITVDYIDLDVAPSKPERNQTVKASAFSDLWLSGRVKLLKFKTSVGPLVTAFQGGVKLPTGDATTDIPVGTGYTDAEGLLLADLRFDLFNANAYLKGFFGYRARGGGYASQQPYNAEFGIAVAPELRIHAGFGGLMSGGSFSYPVGMDANRLITIVGDESYSQVSAGFSFAVSETLGLTFSYVSKISGKNSIAGDTYLIGFELQ